MAVSSHDWIGRVPVAHRGLHDTSAGIWENTLSAVRAAVTAGYAIEIDVQLSADGAAMVFHDSVLDRLTDQSGRFADRSAEELAGLRIGGTEDTVPPLGAVLEAVAGAVPLYIEIKQDGPSDGRLERAVAAALAGYEGPVAAMSFETTSLTALRAAAPDLPRGIVAESFRDKAKWANLSVWQRFARRHLLHLPVTAPHFIAYKVQDMPAPGPVIVNAVLGLPLLVWTVRKHEDVERAKLTGAQMIFEDIVP